MSGDADHYDDDHDPDHLAERDDTPAPLLTITLPIHLPGNRWRDHDPKLRDPRHPPDADAG